MESLISDGYDLGDAHLGKSSLLGIMAFGISQYLGCLYQLRRVSILSHVQNGD